MGFVTFQKSYSHQCLKWPCGSYPFLAPFWVGRGGSFYLRISQDPDTLELVADMITEINPELHGYHPTLVVVITWFLQLSQMVS